MDVNALFNSFMGKTGQGIDRALETAKSTNVSSGLVGGVAAGGIAALILSNKKTRKMGKAALKYGGAAALGGLAYKAWRDHKSAQQEPSPQHRDDSLPAPPRGSIFDLAEEPNASSGEDIRLSLICAMISAAKADGHIDAEERARIESKIAELAIGPEEQSFLVERLKSNSDPIEIARLSRSDEHAAELYLVSAIAIDPDADEEKRYLDRLSDALRLPSDLRLKLDLAASSA